MKDLLDILIFAGLLGSGLAAGIFFAFSTFVMRALGQIPPEQGIAAMRAINVTVLNPWFFGAFFGTGVVCLPIAVLAWGSTAGSQQTYLLAACALYLVGSILVTVVGNVPLNNKLAAVGIESADSQALWSHYLSRWTLWNHVRTAASLATAGLFALALRAAHTSG